MAQGFDQQNQYYTQNQYYAQNQQDQFQYQNNMGYDPAAGQGGVLGQVNALMHQEVIAKSFLYMVAALVVTAIAAFAAPNALAKIIFSSPFAFYGLIIAELAIVIISNIAIL